MTNSLPYCEPIALPDGQTTHCETVSYAEGEEHQCFHHFHDVCEIVLFEQVSGEFCANEKSYRLRDKSLVFVPSMAVHNFALNTQQKRWQILQFSPLLFNVLNLVNEQQKLQQPLVLDLSAPHYQRYWSLIDWLAEFNTQENLLKQDLLSSLLRQLADEAKQPNQQTPLPSNRLQPLLQQIREHQQIDLTMEQAASTCGLSSAYFSRLFKKVFQQSYTQYMLKYRLHLASRLLTTTDHSVSAICYDLNFSHPSYFISVFKQYFGATPHKYRQQ